MHNIPQQTLANAIERAATFLLSQCDPRGLLTIYYSPDRRLETERTLDGTFFGSIALLYASHLIDHPRLVPLAERIRQSLIAEMAPPGVWAFWAQAHMEQHAEFKVVPDIDTTAVASVELRQHHPIIAMGLNIPIILANRNDSGIFKTWMRAGNDITDNDLDSVMNANILFYLGENVHTQAACQYLNRIINDQVDEDTHWSYVGQNCLYYAVSRAWAHGVKALGACQSSILSRLDALQEGGGYSNALETAYAACTLANFQEEALLEDVIGALLDWQQADGSWPAEAVWVWPSPPHVSTALWWGSEALTTCYAVEALAKYHLQRYKQSISFIV